MNIKDLMNKYEHNREYYLSDEYNETQLRADFLDPLFSLFGWDINNSSCKNTNDREVILEEPLKADASENTKKPDYTFRLFSERKFFLEAKKPKIKIETDNNPAKQVRRYGFTGKLKISVLSNFEYLAIYDCSKEINESDNVLNARLCLYHYKDYETNFDEINKYLGRESVYNGTFDDVWKDIEEQLKYSSVDQLFLEQINDWRLLLGEEIHAYQREIDNNGINDIVQSYLNSIIFLRVCEDRNLETYKTLLQFANENDFNALIKKFKNADKKYNSGLFNHALTEEIIENSQSAFWKIIKELYYPESTYSFSVFASDILGNIYENYLGKQLEIESNQIVLQNKPEHIDRDIVTTPTYIIKDILRETLSNYCKDKTDTEIFESKFADIACGSGSFLLEIYQFIIDFLIDYYLQNSPQKLIQTSINTYKLPIEIKIQVLKNCIFGVDKDFNAVEACKFGLLLKLLEDEDNNSIPTPALPLLDENIFFGNSLIDSIDTSSENYRIINAFDFNDIKFDVIVGNPPYMATEHIKKITPLELPIYKKKYLSAYKQFDKYFLFIERCIELLNKDGYLGYIVPSKFIKVGAGKELRKLLHENKLIKKFISFGANQIFSDKTTYTCLLILQNKEQDIFEYFEVHDLKKWKVRNIVNDNYDSINFSTLDDDVWILLPSYLRNIYEKINEQSITLEELIGSENIFNGIQTSANNVYVNTANKEDEDHYYFTNDGIDWKIEKILTRPYFKTSSGSDNLYTYRPFSPNAFVIYPYIKTDSGIEFVTLDKLESDFPYSYKYFLHFKDVLNNPKRDIKPDPETENEWYRYGRHQSLDKCDVPKKIIVGVLSQGNKYAIDYHGTLISSGGTAGYCIITIPDDSNYSIFYIQAVLNSKYCEWYSALIGEVFRGGYIARGTKVLKKLPIRRINFDVEVDKQLHDNISDTQQRLIELQREIDLNSGNNRVLTPIVREFKNEKEILDNLLCKLYSLGEDDKLIPLISEIYATN